MAINTFFLSVRQKKMYENWFMKQNLNFEKSQELKGAIRKI
jgi:hypothetical protein